jgi:prevent-host-death family protein
MPCMAEPETLTARELRDHLGRRIDAAHFLGEPTVITKNGEPRAVLVPYDWYLQQQNRPA